MLVVYLSKLGTIKPEIVPNEYLCTGNTSIEQDEIVIWTNVFENLHLDNLIHGTHVDSPSVIMETNEWIDRHLENDFVDSELGQMAKFTVDTGVEFNYLHFVFDNVS
jgi:hypothetical protein